MPMSGVNMVFIHDKQLSLGAAVLLVNTLPETSTEGVDALTTVDDLNRFLEGQPYSGRIDRDARELAQVRSIRPRLHELWKVDRDGAVPLVNGMLADGRALPQLVTHEGFEEWHIHATDGDAPLHTRIRSEEHTSELQSLMRISYAVSDLKKKKFINK